MFDGYEHEAFILEIKDFVLVIAVGTCLSHRWHDLQKTRAYILFNDGVLVGTPDVLRLDCESKGSEPWTR